MPHLTVRPFTERDLAQAAHILTEVHASDGYPVEGVAEPERWLRAPGVTVARVVEMGGHVVGHVCLMRPVDEDAVIRWQQQSGAVLDRIAVLARLFVAPASRGLGIGQALALAVIDDAKCRGLDLVLDVMAKDRAAICLYERLGFTRIGTTDHRFGCGQVEPALCYALPAGPAA